MAKKAKLEDTEIDNNPLSQIKDFIKSNDFSVYGVIGDEELHNYEDEYISTGSARLDAQFGGGYRPGISLFFGDEETGKTAQGLGWARQWQLKYGDKAYVIYFDAEGRGTKYKLNQSGVDTSEGKFAWVRDNTGEQIFAMIDHLVCKNPLGKRYFFILDSLDAMIRKEDKEKAYTDAQKIAGGAAMQSLAGKRLSNPIHALGHHLYMISQVRAKNITGMGKGDGAKPSGGKAPSFYADVIGRMYKGWTETFIKDGEKIIGNKTKIKFTKSYNEITNMEFDLAIKYKHQGGIWREYEALQIALEWGWLDKKGAWYNFSEMLQNFLDVDKVDLNVKDIKMQGEKNVLQFLQDTPLLVEYMEKKMLTLAL